MNQIIDRAVAKNELIKISKMLKEPHLLIGGLAVQQYIPSRNSQDVDLVCQFDTVNEILDDLYPSSEWNIKDSTSDEYRPSFQITHRFERRGTIIFGPKLLEREAYKFIDWNELKIDSRFFKVKDDIELPNILIPPPHSLAYTKLISFIGRSNEQTHKKEQDLKDFYDLTNHPEFSVFNFYNCLRKTNNAESLMSEFREKTHNFKQINFKSCLHYLSQLFSPNSINSTEIDTITVYLAGPHKNEKKNSKVAKYLSSRGIKPIIPYNETNQANLVERADDSIQIRDICIKSIKQSDMIIVDLDTYGLDTAWEIGFAEGLKKQILGYNEDIELALDTRTYHRRTFNYNFMHGWATQKIFHNLNDVGEYCKERIVYIIGSFSNPEIDKIPMSSIKSHAKKLIFPKSLIESNKILPIDYPVSSRKENNKLLNSADLILVVLPRYGMDASWQIGYATALNKEIIGVILEDDNTELAEQSFWEHWMHGWKEKIRATNFKQLIAIIRGLSEEVI
jgi:nucleoside 2-deoxyribosyltransferase